MLEKLPHVEQSLKPERLPHRIAGAESEALGNGWWRGSIGFAKGTNFYGSDVALLCQINNHPRVNGDVEAAQSAVRGDTRRVNVAPSQLTGAVGDTLHQIAHTENEIHRLIRKQAEILAAPDVLQAHGRRQEIEAEAELKRVRLIRQAVMASKGMRKGNERPSAWWFPLLCPDGLWFRSTVEDAECYLEPLN